MRSRASSALVLVPPLLLALLALPVLLAAPSALSAPSAARMTTTMAMGRLLASSAARCRRLPARSALRSPWRSLLLAARGPYGVSSSSSSSPSPPPRRPLFLRAADAAAEADEPSGPPPVEEFARTELRVGKIVEVWPHPEADKLWCEKIDLGEEEPRQILSGLREFYSQEEMENRTVVVVANLKKSKLRGMESFGMVLAASNEAHDKVELVEPPEGSEVGERVSLATFDVTETPPANAKKKGNSVWRSVAPYLKTNAEGVATYDGVPLVTKSGEVVAPSLKDCTVG